MKIQQHGYFPSPRAGTSVPIPRLLAPGLGLGSISGMPLMLVDATEHVFPEFWTSISEARWHGILQLRNSSYPFKKKGHQNGG